MLNSVQLLRAIAAWIVVFHHFMQVFFDFKATNLIGKIFSSFGSYGVDLFFVISGFVIYHSTAGKITTPAQFMLNRLARIVPAYWLFTLLTAALILAWPKYHPLSSFDNLFLFKSLFFLPANNPSGIGLYPILTVGWTLNFEMLFYLVFCLALFLPESYRVPGIFLGVVFAHSALPAVTADFAFYEQSIIFEFLFGILVAIIYRKGWLEKVGPLRALLLAAIALALTAIGILMFGGGHSALVIGVPSAMILIVAISQEHRFSYIKSIGRLGDWSYSTYLCHIPILLGAYQAYITWNIDPVTALFASCAAILFASWISFSIFEKKVSSLIKHWCSKTSFGSTVKI